MKLKRHIVSLLVVALLVSSMTACSKPATNETDSRETEVTTDSKESETPVESSVPSDETREPRETRPTDEVTPTETTENSVVSSIGYDPEEAFSYTDAYGIPNVRVNNTEFVARWTNASPCNIPYGLVPSDMANDYDKDTSIYNNPMLSREYVDALLELEQYAEGTFETSYLNNLIVGWVPATPNQLVVDTATLSAIGLDIIYLPTDSSNIIIGEYPGMEDICIVVRPYGETVPTLTDIYASTSGASLDEVIASGANGIVRGTVITPNDGAAITYATISQSALFAGPGDYSIRVYIKMNGEWHAVDSTPLNIPVRDLVADGVLAAY